MTSFRMLIPAALCAAVVATAAVPASAEPFHGGGRPGWSDHGGWRHDGGWRHGGWGPGLAIGGLGLTTGALIASSYAHPAYAYGAPSCGETVRTHYDAYGRLVKVVTQTPC